MNVCTWIVCERGGRWTPALRLALARDSGKSIVRQQLREVRHLAELTVAVSERHTGIATLEIHRGNFADALDWFADSGRRFPDAAYVALVDRSIASEAVISALREAGALDIATSPRRLQHLVEFSRRHATVCGEHARLADASDTVSITARAWASLPWQDA